MVKPVTYYKCETCNKEFEDEIHAKHCERNHLNRREYLLKYICYQYYLETIQQNYIAKRENASSFGIDSEPIRIIDNYENPSLKGRILIPKQGFPDGVLVLFLDNDDILNFNGEVNSEVVPHSCYHVLKQPMIES